MCPRKGACSHPEVLLRSSTDRRREGGSINARAEQRFPQRGAEEQDRQEGSSSELHVCEDTINQDVIVQSVTDGPMDALGMFSSHT